VERHRQDLLVCYPLVDQVKQADRSRVHQAAGKYRYRGEHQDVERITILSQSSGKKP
jgi:isopenicillin N synthase-like dioxygenase